MTTIIENLHALRSQLDAMIAAAQADGSGAKAMALPKAGKAKAAKADKKPRANAGQGTAWSAFSSKIQKEHKDEIDIVKAEAAVRRKAAKEAGQEAPEDTKGPHLHWCSTYKEAHQEEWVAFKTAWEAEHPKGSRATSQAGSDEESAAGDSADGAEPKPKKRGAKKMADMTPEEKAAAQAKRAANKAAKKAKKTEADDVEAENFSMSSMPSAAVGGAGPPAAARAPPAEEAEEAEAEDEIELEDEEPLDKLIPFTFKGTKYLRFGHLDEDGEGVWWEGGDIWLQKADGSKGAYVGQVDDRTKKIDSSPAVMAAEPNAV